MFNNIFDDLTILHKLQQETLFLAIISMQHDRISYKIARFY